MIRHSAEQCLLETENGEEKISIDSILWVESSGTSAYSPCLLHTDYGDIICRQNFEFVFPLLGKTFLFCLPHGAVNQLRIRSFLGEQIVMDNGELLTVEPFLAARFHESFCRNLAQWVWEE